MEAILNATNGLVHSRLQREPLSFSLVCRLALSLVISSLTLSGHACGAQGLSESDDPFAIVPTAPVDDPFADVPNGNGEAVASEADAFGVSPEDSESATEAGDALAEGQAKNENRDDPFADLPEIKVAPATVEANPFGGTPDEPVSATEEGTLSDKGKLQIEDRDGESNAAETERPVAVAAKKKVRLKANVDAANSGATLLSYWPVALGAVLLSLVVMRLVANKNQNRAKSRTYSSTKAKAKTETQKRRIPQTSSRRSGVKKGTFKKATRFKAEVAGGRLPEEFISTVVASSSPVAGKSQVDGEIDISTMALDEVELSGVVTADQSVLNVDGEELNPQDYDVLDFIVDSETDRISESKASETESPTTAQQGQPARAKGVVPDTESIRSELERLRYENRMAQQELAARRREISQFKQEFSSVVGEQRAEIERLRVEIENLKAMHASIGDAPHEAGRT